MNKTILITGITKGLGYELLKNFDQNEWTVYGCSRSKEPILELKRAFDKRHFFKALDISDNDSVQAWRDEINAKEPPSILINNASIINQPNPLWKISSEEFNSVVQINLIGAFNVIQSFIPMMLKVPEAKIVNISSYWGKNADENFGPYCSSKFGLEGLTLSLSKELPSNFTTVLVDPGVMQTDMLKICSTQEGYQDAPTAEECAKELFFKILNLKPKDTATTISL